MLNLVPTYEQDNSIPDLFVNDFVFNLLLHIKVGRV